MIGRRSFDRSAVRWFLSPRQRPQESARVRPAHSAGGAYPLSIEGGPARGVMPYAPSVGDLRAAYHAPRLWPTTVVGKQQGPSQSHGFVEAVLAGAFAHAGILWPTVPRVRNPFAPPALLKQRFSPAARTCKECPTTTGILQTDLRTANVLRGAGTVLSGPTFSEPLGLRRFSTEL
jgi:hypothetical protein